LIEGETFIDANIIVKSIVETTTKLKNYSKTKIQSFFAADQMLSNEGKYFIGSLSNK
jgi:hypothetical protein